jgi:hypothetical protein
LLESTDEHDPGPLLEREKSMANEEHLAILRQGVEVWNKWRQEHPELWTARDIDLSGANLTGADLSGAELWNVDLSEADLSEANLANANLSGARCRDVDFSAADLRSTNLRGTDLIKANLDRVNLSGADLSRAVLFISTLTYASLQATTFALATMGLTVIGSVDLSEAVGLDGVRHDSPSHISTGTLAHSKGKIPDAFLRGCGLSDWEIAEAKIYSPDLSNEEINRILYKIYDLRATQALQISPLFISYSHTDSEFINKVGNSLTQKGIRYWRDVKDLKAGRVETQLDRAIRQNPTVLLILSEHSLKSDWVEHEVRTARGLEKEMGRDILCPVALDDSWKSSRWPMRVMEQIMEYNILDFSDWQDDRQFESMFRRLIDGLQLFYKG